MHYRRKAANNPHCAICEAELNGIARATSGGRSRRRNSRLLGGVLCARCTADVVTLGSRIEHGEMKLDAIGVKKRAYVLQLLAH